MYEKSLFENFLKKSAHKAITRMTVDTNTCQHNHTEENYISKTKQTSSSSSLKSSSTKQMINYCDLLKKETNCILILSIILVSVVHIKGQEATNNETNKLPSHNNSEKTNSSQISLTNETTTKTPPPISSEFILSGDEFVDFTEAPLILLDGASNDSNTTTLTTTTSAPIVTSSNATISSENSTLSNNTDNINNKNSRIITTSVSDEKTITTNSPNNHSTMVEDSTVGPLDGEAEEGEGEVEENNDNNNNNNKDEEENTFEPPQNVSQYMDYIERLFHDLRHQITDLFEPHIPQLIRTSQMVQLTNSCSYDMLKLALALRQFEPWALKMIDSSGKVPEGIFEGSFTALGSYDECLSTKFGGTSASSSASSSASRSSETPMPGSEQQQPKVSTTDLITQGKYCLVNLSPFMPPKPPADKVEKMFQEEANRRNYTMDDQFSRLSPMFYYMKFRIGVCVPSTCVNSDLESIANALSSSLRLNITIPHCRVKQGDMPLSNHQLAGGLIFGLVLSIVILSTIMDYTGKKLSKTSKLNRIVIITTTTTPSKQLDETHNDNNSRQSVPVVLRRPKSNLQQQQQQHQEEEESRCCSHLNDSSNCSFKERERYKSTSFLDKHWSWMSFSLLTNYKLYFRGKKTKVDNLMKSGPSNAICCCMIEQHSSKQSSSYLMMIECLNGIRVLSLCWVIIANSYITLDPRATKRLTKTREAPRDFLFQMVVQASLAIETFFFLSGILMSLSFIRKLKPTNNNNDNDSKQDNFDSPNPMGKVNKSDNKTESLNTFINWVHFYVHRYVRMTPATMLVIAFTMFAFRYGDGPLWIESTHKAHSSCSENWWRHLLHIANFIDTRQMCFIHYWYIAADMQLFLFAPILMFLTYKYRHFGYTLISLIGLMSIGNIFYTTYMRSLPPTLLFYNSDPESRREFGNTIMTKPLTHALPYIVGMLVGKWISNQNSNPSFNSNVDHHQSKSSTLQDYFNFNYGHHNSSITTLFGLIALLVALGEVFLPYKWNNSYLPTRFFASLYAALFRLAWSLALAYLVVSCRHRLSKKCRRNRDNFSCASQHQSACDCIKFRNEQDKSYAKKMNGFIVEHKNQLHLAASLNDIHTTKGNENVNVNGNANNQIEWCFCGAGGSILNRLLSLSIFSHLSKLSFVAYLIHLPLMSVFIAQTRGLFVFSHTLVIHLALSYLLMTFILSFILVHIIEFPFLTLERYLFENLFYIRRKNMNKNSMEEKQNRNNQTSSYHDKNNISKDNKQVYNNCQSYLEMLHIRGKGEVNFGREVVKDNSFIVDQVSSERL